MGVETWSDLQMLDVLDRIEGDGMDYATVAARHGRGRGAVAGLMKRIKDDLAASEAAPGPQATKPENCDGGMPRRWWSKRARA